MIKIFKADKINYIEAFRQFVLINIGVLLIAVSTVVFKVPNHFVTGGLIGVSMLVNKAFSFISIGVFSLVVNVMLLLVAGLIFGLSYSIKTIYASIALSVYIEIMQYFIKINAPLTNDPMLELFIAMLISGVGTAIIFSENASTGGTDIIAKILSKYGNFNMGRAVIITDLTICLGSIYFFGLKSGLYSVVGIIMAGFIIDLVMDELQMREHITVVSERNDKIQEYIVNQLKGGATIYSARGAYTDNEMQVISTVLKRSDAMKLKKFIVDTDAEAFVTSSNAK